MSDKNTLKQLGIFLLLLYFFSGMTSLAYEVLWVRMLSLQFGVSIFGVVVTVASFMAGLGMGSIAGSRIIEKSINPLVVFAILEGGVAILALLMPWALLQTESLITGLGFGSTLSAWYAIELLIIGLLLFIPAFMMGIGFPVVLSAIKQTPVSLSYIYGINACGAAFGALLPLMLLPEMGWLNSMRLIAAIGVGVAIAALLLSRKTDPTHFAAEVLRSRPRPDSRVLYLYAGIGAAAKEGIVITNPSKNDPIVLLKHFGPGNPDLVLE